MNVELLHQKSLKSSTKPARFVPKLLKLLTPPPKKNDLSMVRSDAVWNNNGGFIQGGSDGLIRQHRAGQFIQQTHSFLFSLLLSSYFCFKNCLVLLHCPSLAFLKTHLSVAFEGCFSFKLHVRLIQHQMQRCKASRHGCVACGSYLCIFQLCILLCLHWSRALRDMVGSRSVTAIKTLNWSSVAGEVCRYQWWLFKSVIETNMQQSIHWLVSVNLPVQSYWLADAASHFRNRHQKTFYMQWAAVQRCAFQKIVQLKDDGFV